MMKPTPSKIQNGFCCYGYGYSIFFQNIHNKKRKKKGNKVYIYIYMVYKTILCFFSKATLNKMLVFPNQTNGMCWTCGHDR